VMARAGHRFDSPAGRAAAGRFLIETFARVTRESQSIAEGLNAAGRGDSSALDRARAFAARGLASDSGWPINFALAGMFQRLKTRGMLNPARPVRRVAIIGPGLDVIDKDEGFDYYPPQSLQPFAIIDALVALGVTTPAALERVVTVDLNPRVNAHLRSLAAADTYRLELIAQDRPWTEAARTYWAGLGKAIGKEVPAMAPPGSARPLAARAVQLSSAWTGRLLPVDANIVYQRIVADERSRADVLVATNMLLYYDEVEQALAVANMMALLNRDGLLVVNTKLSPAVARGLVEVEQHTAVFSTRPGDGEIVYAYRRAAPAVAARQPWPGLGP
jgi:hypothetical protein